jgi:xanthine dehydrogenase iron-sulfur cluster and FAD-binding subunit A
MDASSIAQVNAMVEAMAAPAQTAQAVDVAVLGKALDAATMQNSALLEMMRDTLNPSVGGTLDISA